MVGQVVRVAVTVPELQQLYAVVHMLWIEARWHYFGEASTIEPAEQALPKVAQLEPLLRRWAADTRKLHSENSQMKQGLVRAKDFQQALLVLLGLGPDSSRTEAQLLFHMRNRLSMPRSTSSTIAAVSAGTLRRI